MEEADLLKTFVEIRLKDPQDFLKVAETLTRIGIPSFVRTPLDRRPKLNQTCHILHKQGHYYLVHFLQMFMLDRKESHFGEEDRGRLNTIASLLDQWGLVEVVDHTMIDSPRAIPGMIKVLPYSEKKNWSLIPKYTIGNVRTPQYKPQLMEAI